MAEHLLQCVSIAARGNAAVVLGTLGRPQLDSTGSDMCMFGHLHDKTQPFSCETL